MPNNLLKASILLCINSLLVSLSAQELHMPETCRDSAGFMLCQPGVPNKSPGRGLLLEYSLVGHQRMAPPSGPKDGPMSSKIGHVERFVGKIKLPIVHRKGFNLLLGYEYSEEVFHFDHIGDYQTEVFTSLDGESLRTNQFAAYLTKVLNERMYLGAKLGTTYRGSYDGAMGFSPKHANYGALGLLGIKPRPDLEWGVGLGFSKNFFQTIVLPFFIYNQTFNDRWGIESVLPVQIRLRYNAGPGDILMLGLEYQSDAYAVDVPATGQLDASHYYFRHAEIALKATYDKHLFSWAWFNAEAGFQVARRSRFDHSERADLDFRVRSSPQPFLRTGLFLCPPRNRME